HLDSTTTATGYPPARWCRMHSARSSAFSPRHSSPDLSIATASFCARLMEWSASVSCASGVVPRRGGQPGRHILRCMPWFSAVELADTIRRRQVSCVEVMGAYLDRIAALNPRVNAIVAMRDPDE